MHLSKFRKLEYSYVSLMMGVIDKCVMSKMKARNFTFQFVSLPTFHARLT